MSRVLFATIPEKGHVNPLVGVAQHLERRGHVRAFAAAADLGEHLRRAGLAARSIVLDAPPLPEGFVTRGRAFADKIREPAWLRAWIKALLIDAVEGQLPAVAAAIRSERPDVVVTDPMLYAAVLAAEIEGVPWAGVSSSLNPVTPEDWTCELTETARALAPERERLFARHGAGGRSFKICDAISPWLNTVFTTEAYVPRAVSGNEVSFHVGPALPPGPRGDEPPFPWERLAADRPVVYMSLGSQLFHHPELFSAVAEALVPEGVQLVVAAGDLAGDPELLGRLPGAVVAVPYAPQLALLDRASLLVTHGGANSVMEGLSRGAPILTLPICNDQPLQARLLERSGAGAALDPGALTAARCRDVALPMLDRASPQRARARAIARSYAAHDGALTTADLVEQLARTGRPLRPASGARAAQPT